MSDLPAVDRLAAELDRALALPLPPEQRELLADAIVARLDPMHAPLPPRLRELAESFSALLDEIEREDGAPERDSWALTVAQDLTGPHPFKKLSEMSADDLERAEERHRKYGPDV